MKLARMLKLYRAAEGIEQKALAKEIGIGASTLCRIENGKSPDARGMAKIILWLVQ